MITLRSFIKTITSVACSTLILSLVAGVAVAGKKPPGTSYFWSAGAQVVAQAGYSYGFLTYVMHVTWPAATIAPDHYKVIAVRKDGSVMEPQFSYDASANAYVAAFGTPLGATYVITVIAWADASERGYSETLTTHASVPKSYPK
jgi:hypothetical protein